MNGTSGMILRAFAAGLIIALMSAAVCGQDVKQGWTPDLMMQFKRVGATAISPDGKLIAYTVSTPLREGELSEFLSHIWVVRSDGSENRQYTFGERSCTNPSFSPDGASLAFLSTRGKDGKNQLWVMPVTGGEARQLTFVKGGITRYRWSPDGRKIGFLMTDPLADAEEKAKKEKRDWIVVDRALKFDHLYTTSAEPGTGDSSRVRRLSGGSFHVTAFDWSPDGSVIAFSHQPLPGADPWLEADISAVPSDSGAVMPLVQRKGYDSDPRFSPDGAWIAFVSDGGDSHWAHTADVWAVAAAGGPPRKLAATPDRRCGLEGWSANSREVYASEIVRTSRRYLAVPIEGSDVRELTPGPGTFSGASFSKRAGMMAFVYETPEKAPDVHVSKISDFKPARLTDVNASFPKLPLGKTVVVSWTSGDGRQIEGLLTYPVGWETGRRYPLILLIHGGPASVFTQGFTAGGSTYPLQAFAQRGYAVLRPNPRGSSGYGREFRFANVNDWGFGDFDDDIAGVEKVIEMGVAHPESLAVCGWSYGGFMTSFIITRTNRFKAASVGAGVTNLMSFVGTSDIPSFVPDYFLGDYWDRMETYMRHSAMFQVKNVRTPTLILHGEKDERVPLSQGQELYVALRRLGVPVEMVVYPRMPHGLQEPKFIVDAGERMLAWFDRHLGRHDQQKAPR